MSLPERNIEDLWNLYSNLLLSTNKSNSENIQKLLDNQGQRIIECTYTQKISEPFCGIGGLVEYSIKLARTAKKIAETFQYNVSHAAVIKCALLSEIGRIGNLSQDRLKISDSEWHKEKLGQYYNWNDKCEKYSINHMTLFYMSHYDIRFTWEEYQSLILLNAENSDVSNFYGSFKSDIATILLISKEIILKKEKQKIDGTHSIPF